jgi:hypothetical protein
VQIEIAVAHQAMATILLGTLVWGSHALGRAQIGSHPQQGIKIPLRKRPSFLDFQRPNRH